MRIFGIDINSGRSVDIEKKDAKNNLWNSKFKDQRTALDQIETLGDSDVRIPYYPLPPGSLYELTRFSDTIGTVHFNIKKEIFRNGVDIKEKFALKCTGCDKEFDHPLDICDDCKEAGKDYELITPDHNQKLILEANIKSCNDNNQKLLTVCEEFEDDLNTIDDGYVQCIKDYYFNGSGILINSIPIEFLRVSPLKIHIISDKSGRPGRDSDGNVIKTCLVHRRDKYINKDECPRCGRELFKAMYRGIDSEGKHIYYIDGEIYHTSKYNPSLTYGFSPLFSCWLKASTLMNMDRYMHDYYAKQRPPRGLLFVRTPNQGSLQKAWNWMLDMFKQNPHMIPPIAIEGENLRGNQFVQFIDFMRSLDEMQFTQMREEFRRTIGAVYQVMPIFQADMSQGGGLNNEGMEITVTDRATESGQNIYNNGFIPWYLEQLGITDYELKLNPSKEKDEMADLLLENQKIQNARLMQSMGYDVTLNEDSEFEYEPLELPVTPPAIPDSSGMPPIAGKPPQDQSAMNEKPEPPASPEKKN